MSPKTSGKLHHTPYQSITYHHHHQNHHPQSTADHLHQEVTIVNIQWGLSTWGVPVEAAPWKLSSTDQLKCHTGFLCRGGWGRSKDSNEVWVHGWMREHTLLSHLLPSGWAPLMYRWKLHYASSFASYLISSSTYCSVWTSWCSHAVNRWRHFGTHH